MLEDILKAKNNDKKAIEKLLKENESVIQAQVSKFFVKGMEEEDLKQEASIAFLDSIKTYDPEQNDNFPAFASICIERKLITLLSSSQRQKNIPLNTSYSLDYKTKYNDEDSVMLLDLIEEDSDTTEEKIIKEEKLRILMEKTEKILSKFEKEVLSLYFKGYSYNEMAKKLNSNDKAIDNAIQRIKQKIKREKLL